MDVYESKLHQACCAVPPFNPHKNGVYIKRTQLNFVWKICDFFECQYHGVHSYQ
jgi:hypothetical protein